VRDRRLFDALQTVATNTAIETGTRLAAIAALAAQVDPGLAVTFRAPPDGPRVAPDPFVQIARLSHSASVNGAQPLDKGAARRVVELLSQLSTSDPDSRVRHATSVIAKHLAALK
jgi:hypothetical protein